jgi:hypothetical protein
VDEQKQVFASPDSARALAPEPEAAHPKEPWMPARDAMPAPIPFGQRAPATAVTPDTRTTPPKALPTKPAAPPAVLPQTDIAAAETRKSQLESELNVLRREMSRLQSAKQATDHELLESRRSVQAFEQRLVKVKTTISYQLGSALVQSNQSWKGIAQLPARLFGVYRASRALRRRSGTSKNASAANIARSTEAIEFIKSALMRVDESGAQAATQQSRPCLLTHLSRSGVRSLGTMGSWLPCWG